MLNSSAQNLSFFSVKLLKCAVFEIFADILHKFVIKTEIMKHRKSHSENFVCRDKVAEICTGMIFAERAVALVVDGSRICYIFRIMYIYYAFRGEKMSVTGVA